MALKHSFIQMENVNLDYYWGVKCFEDIVQHISKIDADKYIIVTDSTIYDIYGEKLFSLFSQYKPTCILSSPAGEKYKSQKTISTYLKNCFKFGVTRKSLVIGFGGGIPGNVAGLLASLTYRGIKFVQVPTTSIAMFDSVLSLKQAVNSDISKNSIGCFYKPEAIYADLSLLETLSLSHRRSGLCETIKNTLAISPGNIDELKSNLSRAMEGNTESLSYILQSSINSKKTVMKDDKFEKNKAVILEYGHTIGHACEIILSKKYASLLTHGEAVGLGMIVAAHISQQLGYMDQFSLNLHYELLETINVSLKAPQGIDATSIINLIMFDNKRGYINVSKNEVAMVLLKALGEPVCTGYYPLYAVPSLIIKENLKNILN